MTAKNEKCEACDQKMRRLEGEVVTQAKVVKGLRTASEYHCRNKEKLWRKLLKERKQYQAKQEALTEENKRLQVGNYRLRKENKGLQESVSRFLYIEDELICIEDELLSINVGLRERNRELREEVDRLNEKVRDKVVKTAALELKNGMLREEIGEIQDL